MTKRRPWWSDRWRQAVALACGLLLLPAWPPLAAAAGNQPAGKPPVIKKISKKPLRGKASRRPGLAAPALGAAEFIEAAGLHGSASFYGHGFQGRRTSTGERFDVKQFTAASNHFPLGSLVAVRRLDNDRCAIVKVNDRMAGHRRRIVDVSRSVAEYLDMIRAGVVLVRVAPLRAGWSTDALGACQAAFAEEPACADCGRPPRLPDFSSDTE